MPCKIYAQPQVFEELMVTFGCMKFITGTGFLTPLLYEDLIYCLTLFLKFFPTTSWMIIRATSNVLFYLTVWVTTFFESWYLSTSSTPYYVFFFMARYQGCNRFDTGDIAFTSTLIWYHTHKQIQTHHTQRPIGWHMNIC